MNIKAAGAAFLAWLPGRKEAGFASIREKNSSEHVIPGMPHSIWEGKRALAFIHLLPKKTFWRKGRLVAFKHKNTWGSTHQSIAHPSININQKQIWEGKEGAPFPFRRLGGGALFLKTTTEKLY